MLTKRKKKNVEVMSTYGLMGFLSLQRGTERESDRASERENSTRSERKNRLGFVFVFVFQGSDDVNVVC